MKKKIQKKQELQVQSQGTTPAEMIKLAVTGGADLDKLEKLLTLQERWEGNEARKAYNTSMVAVHKAIPLIGKSLKNLQTHSTYASLDEIICKTKEIYTGNGFSISFYEGSTDKVEYVRICADVIHQLGHKETYHYDVPLDGRGIKGNVNMTLIHAKASSTSYARRYLMCMIWNIPTGDDDGNAGGGLGKPEVEMPGKVDTPPQTTTERPPASPRMDEPPPNAQPPQSARITMDEAKYLVGLAQSNGYLEKDLKDYLKTLGYGRVIDILKGDYQTVIDWATLTKADREEMIKEWDV